MGFVAYGALLNGIGNIDSGYRFSSLGVSLLNERFSSVKAEWLPRVHGIHYGINAQWKQSMNSSLETLYEAYEKSLETGDLEYTYIILFLYCRNRFQCGCSLSSQEPLLKTAVDTMHELNQKQFAELTSLTYEATLILAGKEDDPAVTNGFLLHMEDPSNTKLQDLMSIAGLSLDMYMPLAALNRMIASYHTGDMDTALQMEERSRNFAKSNNASVITILHAFYSSLTCLTVVRQNPGFPKATRRYLLNAARDHLDYIKKRCKFSPQNMEPLQFLLEGEFDALNGKINPALAKYAKSQELAARVGCLDVQALACERASLTIHEGRGNESQKIFLLERCIELYAEWGAMTKLRLMEALMEEWKSLNR